MNAQCHQQCARRRAGARSACSIPVSAGSPFCARCCSGCRTKTSSISATRRGCLTAPRARVRSVSIRCRRRDCCSEYGVKCLVVACNTASAVALDALAAEFAPVPVLGVLEPGAAAACRGNARRPHRGDRDGGHRAWRRVPGGDRAPAARLPRSSARACPIFVALAEEGWTDGPVVEAVIRRYLDDVFVAGRAASHPDTLVLGCTHFPVLAPALSGVLGPDVAIVDSAATTADALADALAAGGLPPPQPCRNRAPAGHRRCGALRPGRRRVSRPSARGGRRRDRGPAQRAVARSPTAAAKVAQRLLGRPCPGRVMD